MGCINIKTELISQFQAARTPSLFFGSGSVLSVGKITKELAGKKAAIFTGASFLKKSIYFDRIHSLLDGNGLRVLVFSVPGEPSPSIVDNAVEEIRKAGVSFILAAGGGSVIDAGKAASVMAYQKGSVADYLEGVGGGELIGKKIPFAAIPTTSGTGSEATKNSVISNIGEKGFKKSLRHDCMVPDFAIIDPDLLISCPPTVTASSGMDAVTQLLESFVSTKASVFTDALASSALSAAGRCLEKACKNGNDIEARSGMAWAAYISGITLANAGLGVVHGIAAPAGGFKAVPHGVVCGTLLLPATRYIINRLLETAPEGIALDKYAKASSLLTGRDFNDKKEACKALVDKIGEWTEKLDIPRLGKYGFDKTVALKTAAASDGKNSPVRLDSDDIFNIIMDRV